VSRALASDSTIADMGGENSNQGFIDWLREELLPLVERDASIVLIDHTGHAEKDRTRGASAKRQQVDVEYQIELEVPFSTASAGSSKIVCRKERTGFFTSGETIGHLKVDPGRPDGYGGKFRLELDTTMGLSVAIAKDAIREAAETERKRISDAKWKAEVMDWAVKRAEKVTAAGKNIREADFNVTDTTNGLRGIRSGGRRVLLDELVDEGKLVDLGTAPTRPLWCLTANVPT
jgi:hypothetical protein